jgi:Mn2+/Fe2+ NRAMP family transporter
VRLQSIGNQLVGNRAFILFAAVVLAITIGVGATIAGALAHTETRYIEGDVEYHLYGWPWDWKTDASAELIRFRRDNAINYRYDDSGFAL